jgi:hypothetical protein
VPVAGTKKEVTMNNRNEPINVAIRDNEKAATDWQLNELATELYWWTDFFNIAFFKSEPVPVPVISFEATRVTNLGHFVIGRNAFGVLDNININRMHLGRPMWNILATLLHELTHSWEHIYVPESKRTKNWFHKVEFRKKLASFGIICDEKGGHVGYLDPFVHLLRQHGVPFDVPEGGEVTKDGIIKVPPEKKKKGKSKLKKWSCGCTNARVAVELKAKCLKCGNEFELQE